MSTTKEKLRLVIADDHHILLDGLRSLLSRQKDMDVLGYFDDGQKLFDALPALLPVDIALIDINMPGLDGHQLTLKIRETYGTDIAVIVLSMYDDGGHIMDLVEAGTSGYLLKNTHDAELLNAIRMVAKGRMYFSPEVADKIEQLVHTTRTKEVTNEPHLTEREIEILRLIADELSNAEIAARLFISERTVETHRKNMLRKTGHKSVVGLLRYGMEKQLIK